MQGKVTAIALIGFVLASAHAARPRVCQLRSSSPVVALHSLRIATMQ